MNQPISMAIAILCNRFAGLKIFETEDRQDLHRATIHWASNQTKTASAKLRGRRPDCKGQSFRSTLLEAFTQLIQQAKIRHRELNIKQQRQRIDPRRFRQIASTKADSDNGSVMESSALTLQMMDSDIFMPQPLPPNFCIASSRRFAWAIAARRGLTATAARRGFLGQIYADAEQMLGGMCVAD